MSELTRRSLLAGGLAGAAALPLLATGARAQTYGQPAPTDQMAPAAPAAANEVVIQNMAFNPAALTVAAGTTVRFTNQDGVTHTVTADNGSFDVDNLAPGMSVQITFPGAGTYPYHCEIHPSMRGAITVA